MQLSIAGGRVVLFFAELPKRRGLQSWPSLLAMILPHQDDDSAGEQKLKVEAVRAALARMPAQQGKSLAQVEALW